MKTESHKIKKGLYKAAFLASRVALLCITLASSSIHAEQDEWQNTVARIAEYYDNHAKQASVPVTHQAPPTPNRFLSRFPAGEELIFTLNVAGYNRGEIFAVVSEYGLKIGLAELSALLDFNIDVSPDGSTAKGWFFNSSNRFLMQPNEDNKLVIIANDERTELQMSDYNIDGDALLEIGVLAKTLGLSFSADESRLILYVTSKNVFAFESAEARRARLIGASFSRAPSVLPEKNNDYSLYTPPLFDAQLTARATDTSTFTGYSLASSQDLAYVNTQLFLSGDDEDTLREARVTFSRDSDQADVLGLPLTYAAVGDVLPINAGIGQTPSFGRGIALSNVRNALADNRIVNFTGVIQAGWDVELYRNGILLANAFDIQDGRYEFTDIELLFGNNDFELLFYGPQGQIQREEKTYLVDGNSLKRGESSFRFSAVDSNETVLGVTNVTDDPTQKGINAGFVYEQGLNDWYTIGLGGTYFAPDEGDNFSTVSLRNNLSLGSLGLVNSVVQLNSEDRRNYLVNYRSRFLGNSLSVLWRKDEGQQITDEDSQQQDGYRSQSLGFTLNGRTSGSFFIPLDYESSWFRNWNQQGDESESFRQSLFTNTSIGGVNYAFLGNRSNTSSQHNDWEYTSELGYRNRFGRAFTRLFATYQHSPESTLESVGTSLNYPFSNNFNGELRYAYSAINHSSSYNARLNWFGEKVTISSFASYSDDDQWSISLLARFGLALNADQKSLALSPRPITGSGALAVRVYEDQNLNSVYDDEEPLLDGVKVNATQVSRTATTEEGLAFIERLPKNRRTDIVIDESTLPDFTYMRADDGFSVTGRPGLLQFADIPVVRSGELDGTLYLMQVNGEERTLSYVNLYLINEKGETVASTKSEYDGFYLFEKILPGNYKLLVDSKDLQRQSAALDITKTLNVTNRGDVFSDVDIVLTELLLESGYMAKVSEFSSLPLLKVYLSLIEKRLPDDVIQEPFYLATKNNSYLLSLGYSKDSTTMEALCTRLQDFNIDCEVAPLELGQ